MFTKFTLSMIIIILLVSLASCGTISSSNKNISDSTNNSQSNPLNPISNTTDIENYQMLPIVSGDIANIKLDASADGTTQQLKKGEVMSITLETNPSTGYSWFAAISNAGVLVQMGEPDYATPAESATPLLGASEKVTFYFQATETGTATLTLDYKRGWEADVSPEKTITLTVEVQ